MKISTILDQIDIGSIALPEFQRGYVWNRDQVRSLMQSLYRKYPVGGLLVWATTTENVKARGDGPLSTGSVKLLLDGQQRITSLYGIIRGHQPKFFDGNAQVFSGLYFSLHDESFEFYTPLKMRDNPLWINITELMKNGIGSAIQKLYEIPELKPKFQVYINRLTSIDLIKEIDLHIEEVSGDDKTVDIVVDIFNRVNSGGTKLSKGDLALAKICAEWPQARDEMKARLEKWKKADFNFRLELLMRCINSILTGEALFSALKDVNAKTFRDGLIQAEKSIDSLLNIISARLGLDHDRVLGSRYSFPILARYLVQRGGHLADHRERDKLLYWYIHTFLWGRYAGSTESVLNQDLASMEDIDIALDRLIGLIQQSRGDLRLRANDFIGWSKGARFYPLLYMLTRVCHAKDFYTGVDLSNHMLGRFSRLEIHHIFPKALLYEENYPRNEVNALANLTFLTKETNLQISDRDPEEYLSEIAASRPGVLESHWIPMDRKLWEVENYSEFLEARRELLAKAANDFLDNLLNGATPDIQITPSILEKVPEVATVDEEDKEEQILQECNQWVVQQGLPEGEFMYELTDLNTGEPLAILDLAWPNGLQEGYSQSVAVLLEGDKETESFINGLGYRYFTSVDAFRTYIQNEILATTD